MEQAGGGVVGVTFYLMAASAALVFAGLTVEAATGSAMWGNALICLAIIVMIAALFTIEPPEYMQQIDRGSGVPLRLWD